VDGENKINVPRGVTGDKKEWCNICVMSVPEGEEREQKSI
jgi:hypothetical protein